ncbi:potassium transporter [Clostridia bacterium]|nr:potassium transporter [Clostridia bacterium]
MFIRHGTNVYWRILLIIGAATFVPLLVLCFYPQEYRLSDVLAFLLPSLFLLASGLLTAKFSTQKTNTVGEYETSLQKGSLPVLFAWVIAIIAGALPFIIGGKLEIIHALFESTSGWTTTGLSIFDDVEDLPHIYLFHRAFMQYCGGLGLILMLIVFSHGKQTSLLFDAEGHSDNFTPSIKRTGRTIFAVYNFFLAAGTLLYVLFGMDFFDAICFGMSSISTAGFTTKNEGIFYFDSIPIELTTVGLMLIGATSFAVLTLLASFDLKKIIKVTETRFMFFVMLIFTPLIRLGSTDLSNFGKYISDSLFIVVSTFSTTGYSLVDREISPFSYILLLMLMLVGGSVGSTSGGIKMLRVYLLFRIAKENIRRKLVSPRRVLAVNYSKVDGVKNIDSNLISDTLGFIVTYFAILITGTLAIILTEGCSASDGFYEFLSAFGNVGFSSGITNYYSNNLTLIIEMFGMVLGRLEIFIVFIGIYTLINRKVFNGNRRV